MVNLNEEKKLRKKGYQLVIGLDEAGRGPLAGPVIAAAVAINPKLKPRNLKEILNSNFPNSKHVSGLGFQISNLEFRDSKKLTPKARNKLYKILTTHREIWWKIGIVSEKVIDKINILEATKLAMEKAVNKLIFNFQFPISKTFLILDGNFKIDLPLPQKSIIKADEKVFSCVAAGIIAKVYRDRIMQKYQNQYPQYGFDRHKGYPTKFHRKMLKIYGPCKIHRRSFSGVAS